MKNLKGRSQVILKICPCSNQVYGNICKFSAFYKRNYILLNIQCLFLYYYISLSHKGTTELENFIG